jgi:alginate O-acetyltransferase complex protein AlgI
VALTFGCVCLGWVFFRATSFASAAQVLHRLVVPRAGVLPLPRPAFGLWLVVAVVVMAHWTGSGAWQRGNRRLPAPVLGFGYAAAVMLALLLTPSAGKPFIYFQF